MDLNLERPHVRPLPSRTHPTECIDLTRPSTAPGQLTLDRPHHRAGSSPSVTTPPASINLERPLRKSKSTHSYAGLPPLDKPSFTAEGGTNSSVNQELTVQEWADDKLAFPRTKVGDASIVYSVTNPRKNSLRSAELNKWISSVKNLSSRRHDPVQAIDFLRNCTVDTLLNAEGILEVLNEVKDEIHSAREDFLRVIVDSSKPDL